MRVLLVTDIYQDFVGGIITLIHGIEKVLTAQNHEYKVIHPKMFQTRKFKEFNDLEIATDPWKMQHFIESYQPDLVLVCGESYLSITTANFCRYNDLPFLTFYQTKIPEFSLTHFGIPTKVSYRYLEWYHRGATKVLSISPSMSQQLHQNTNLTNVTDWFGGVDLEKFNPSKKELITKYNPDFSNWAKPILLCVCRASEEKNIDEFLACTTEGTKVYIGDGPVLSKLKSKYQDTKFLGFKHGEELAAYYAAADCFVFPSQGDAFGMVVIEALASGTPVAGFEATGIKDIVEISTTGYLAKDKSELSNAIKLALQLDREVVYKNSLKFGVDNSVQLILDNAKLIGAKSWKEIENPTVVQLLYKFQRTLTLMAEILDYLLLSLMQSRMSVFNILIAYYAFLYFLFNDFVKLVKANRS